MKNLFFERVTVLGVGLIGASFSLAVKNKGLCGEITGFGRNRENLGRARDKGIIDKISTDAAEACRDSDLIFLSTPVGSFLDLAQRCAPSLKRGAIVTDAGSVKGHLVSDIERLMPDGVHFIGAHPIAGSDRSGFESSSADLFENAKCIVTPTSHSDASALDAVLALWKSLGSQVLTMDAETHDKIYAAVSHLPHILAYSLVNTVAGTDKTYLDFCGQGFRDTTRIAASSHELWRDICLMNRQNLLDAISAFQKNLDALSQYLRASDADSLEKEFRRARTLREGIGQN